MEFLGTKGDWIHTKRYDHHIEVDGKVLITIHCLESGKPKYDGRLVSKAPEMLEMLKEANKVIEWYMENAKPDDNHTDFFNIGMNQRTQIEELIQSATTI